ncbi:MAG: IS3 family transposase [Desulfobacula sp.]|nr:IS3 family transposase [Desulfobacula sp.]
MNSESRRKFDPDFKRNAVLLCAEPGRSVVEVANNLGIGKDLLYRWRREYHRANGQYVFPGNGIEALTPDKERIRELEKKLRDTEMERDILKKSNGHLQQDIEMKYRFIKDHRSEFTMKKMCQKLKISMSGFYHWINRPLSARDRKNEFLKERIFELFAEHNGMAGSPMITADLHDDPEFFNVSQNRVARLMREMDLKCKTLTKFVASTDSKHNESVAPNLLNRGFDVKVPNTVWVTDITYLKIGRKWYYLTIFIDLFSRCVVGWDLRDSLERHSVIRALNKAIIRRRPGRGLMIHSDRGVQYASQDFKKALKKHRFIWYKLKKVA